MSRSIKRIYHPYWKWEEQGYNMWGKSKNRKDSLQAAVEFTGDPEKYGRWMRKVVREWKYSCEHNLSDRSQNRRAWIGHAACAYAIQCPEDIVRAAWSFLTKEQQALANAQADNAIEIWEKKHLEELCLK